MLLSRFLLVAPLFFGALCSAVTLPLRIISSQASSRPPKERQDEGEIFSSGETVFRVAEELRWLQNKNSGLHQLWQERHGQVVKQDLVSTQFHSYSTTFNLSISGGIWGFNQKLGYYRFANGTVSTEVSTVDIGNDIAVLSPNNLTEHVFEAVEALNNLTYPFLGLQICGGGLNLRQVLDPLRSSEAMTAFVKRAPDGVGITLETGAQSGSPASGGSIAASAIGFVTIMNNGIIQRIFEQGWVDFVDAFIIEIYVALGHRIADKAETFLGGDCVAPRDAVAGMNGLSVTLEDLMSTKSHTEDLQEL